MTVQKPGVQRDTAVARASYVEARRLANRVVWLAKSDAEAEKFANVKADSKKVFHISKRIAFENKDVVGETISY